MPYFFGGGRGFGLYEPSAWTRRKLTRLKDKKQKCLRPQGLSRTNYLKIFIEHSNESKFSSNIDQGNNILCRKKIIFTTSFPMWAADITWTNFIPADPCPVCVE